ncbi:autophagy protein Apg9-domain-containing protein [Stachybotrys elegans]|uniref:Autophagy-related protein 9 n=1 Tax=Stachybotrys elegans TaxID=80388 RepID=A0A8K0T1Y4_9HYPO|nr:autophagy protein Apg9-domain-containing protein [Stachybotrys elegans]
MSNIFGRLAPPSRGTRSFYEEMRARDEDVDIEDDAGRHLDEENLRHHFSDFDTEGLTVGDSRITVDSAAYSTKPRPQAGMSRTRMNRDTPSKWPIHDDEIDNDVPASLLVEPNEVTDAMRAANVGRDAEQSDLPLLPPPPSAGPSSARSRAQWEAATAHQKLHDDTRRHHDERQPRSLMAGVVSGSRREQALWRWVNTTNLDSFMRDVYDYYEGGGLWCILCSNALWLLKTLFVAIFLTFLGQCVDYSKIPHSKTLDQIVVPQCTRKMSTLWNLGIWLYSFFFIWKSVQYFFEIRRLVHIREFFVHLLDIPEQDMQTVSWQDVVARIMALRDQNPKTASNIPPNLRRFIGSQSKERLDAHDIANRLMRKENYLIAMINKDVLDLSLPVPFLRGRQLFSKTMEWYLHYGILDMAFNELGQVQQDFLRADRRGILSQKLKQRLYFAGLLNLIFAPVVLAYVVIVYFFTYYNEYQKDPKLAAARKYTSLAEWKFREFNELPHIFYERLHMSFPFATRYLDQFPKRMTDDIARSIAFMSGAITAVLAVGTVLDSELFLSFEITKDRTVLFYLGIFGAVWAMTRGMVSEETQVFNPEYALRNVIEYTHYMPDHWKGRLHSAEVKQEFSELYKMKVVIFLEEIMGIITTPLLLLFSLPKCSDQIVDFFREFTIHVDGLGYVCSFAVFDFKKGVGHTGQQQQQTAAADVREDYYSTKHGKMAASYYGFIDNYVINPKTGIPGHLPPGMRQPFHPPPAFPGLGSPTLGADMQSSLMGKTETGRARSRVAGMGAPRTPRFGPAMPQPSPMASLLLDPHHHPAGGAAGARSVHRSRHPRGGYRGEDQIIEEGSEGRLFGAPRFREEESIYETGGALGESMWETSPGKGLSRENSAANTEEPDTGVLGLIYQLRQTQHNRRGGGVV